MKALVTNGTNRQHPCRPADPVQHPLGLITWVEFLSRACFVAASEIRAELLKAIPANLSGVLWGVASGCGDAPESPSMLTVD